MSWAKRLGAVSSLLGLAGCTLVGALGENREHVQQVSLGMSKAQVAAVMGTGVVYHHSFINITNPWRSDSMVGKDGKPIEVLYYLVDERNGDWSSVSDDELTPIVLVDDKVVGIGWTFLRQNEERLEVRLR